VLKPECEHRKSRLRRPSSLPRRGRLRLANCCSATANVTRPPQPGVSAPATADGTPSVHTPPS